MEVLFPNSLMEIEVLKLVDYTVQMLQTAMFDAC